MRLAVATAARQIHLFDEQGEQKYKFNTRPRENQGPKNYAYVLHLLWMCYFIVCFCLLFCTYVLCCMFLPVCNLMMIILV
jgi:hypothetical protein